MTDQRQLTQLQNELIHPALKKDEAIQLVEKFEPSRPRTGASSEWVDMYKLHFFPCFAGWGACIFVDAHIFVECPQFCRVPTFL